MSLIRQFIDLGTKRHADITIKKHVRFTNFVALFVMIFIIQNLVLAIVCGQTNMFPVLITHFAGIALVPVFNVYGKRVLGAVCFSIFAIIFVTIYAHVYTLEGLNFVFLSTIIFLLFFMFARKELSYMIAFTVIVAVCIVSVIAWETSGIPLLMTVSDEFIQVQRLNTLIGLPLLCIAFGYYAYYTVNSAELEAAYEREKTERLLLNTLPKSIAERFKEDQSYFAQRYESATVLFADLVGFTTFSEKISPDNLVMFLNTVFSKFDAITEECGVEKIKTLGDAYMVAGGIPIITEDHTQRICTLALKMREAMQDIKSPDGKALQIRIGICTGPVTAGVIGVKKFIYDLWGDTVNTASRMQSHAPDGGIQITESVYEQVRDAFECVTRGVVNVRGKGDMRTYLVVGGK